MEMVSFNAHYSVLWGFICVNEVSVRFLYNNFTLKILIKHRYNYTDSALMG